MPESVLRDVMKAKKDSGWKMFNWFSRSKSKKISNVPEKSQKKEVIAKISPSSSPQKDQAPNQKEPVLNKEKSTNMRYL